MSGNGRRAPIAPMARRIAATPAECSAAAGGTRSRAGTCARPVVIRAPLRRAARALASAAPRPRRQSLLLRSLQEPEELPARDAELLGGRRYIARRSFDGGVGYGLGERGLVHARLPQDLLERPEPEPGRWVQAANRREGGVELAHVR